jgi:integrase
MQVGALRQLAQRIGWDRDIQKVSSRDIEMFRSNRSKDEVSPMTVNKEVKSLRCLFNLAIKRGYLGTGKNPCTGVTLIKVGEKRPAYMSPAKFERLYEQADSLLLRAMLVVFYTTGLRRNEAVHLTWDDIDFENAVLHVARHSADGYIQAWTPKDHERREVPLPGKAIDMLHELKESAPVGCPYVFMNSARWAYYQQQVDTGQWKPETSELVNNVLKKFQLRCDWAQIGRYTLHDLRRSCITNWARQGLPIHVAQKLAGHADIETTQKFYLSVQDEDLQKARAVQQQLVSGLPMVHATDQLLTISGQNRTFPKRRIYSDGTEVPEEEGVI